LKALVRSGRASDLPLRREVAVADDSVDVESRVEPCVDGRLQNLSFERLSKHRRRARLAAAPASLKLNAMPAC